MVMCVHRMTIALQLKRLYQQCCFEVVVFDLLGFCSCMKLAMCNLLSNLVVCWMLIDLDNSVPFRSSPRPQSVEGVSETVNLAHDTPFLYSSVHFNATTARYGLLQCRIDDGASNKSHHRFFLVLPPGISCCFISLSELSLHYILAG